MPFQGSRGPIILALIFIVIIVVVIAVIGSVSTAPRRTAGAAVCTVKTEIGVEYITINNRNTGGGEIIVPSTKLPFSFNFTRGDEIVFKAYPLTNYEFNAWRFTFGEYAGTWDEHNPLTLQPSSDLTLIVTVQYVEPSPTPTPTSKPSGLE